MQTYKIKRNNTYSNPFFSISSEKRNKQRAFFVYFASMKKFILFTFILLAVCSMTAQESHSYQFTLEDCLRYAFANSNERKSMELTGKSLEATYEQSKQQRLPNLNASVGQNISNNAEGWSSAGNVNLGSSITIYQGGQINNTIKQNKLNVERNEVQMERFDNQIVIQILQSFLTIIGNQELLKYQLEVLKTSGEQLKQGQTRYQVGSILESDFLLLEAQYYSDSNNVVDTRINIENNLLDLKVLLSMDPTDSLEIISPDTENLDLLIESLPSEEEAIQLTMNYMPDLRLSDYDIQIAEKNVAIAKGNYFPSVSASASVGTGIFSFDKNGMNKWINTPTESAGISVNIPIYSRGATRANVKKSQISLEQARLDHEQAQLEVRQNVVQAYRNVISAHNAYKVSEIKEQAYSKSFEAYNTQFRFGKITTVELLQQQNNYLNVLNSYIQNKYSLVLKRKILDVYMGKRITL